MNIFENQLYKQDLKYVASLDLPWEQLKNKSVLISGGTGLIGSFLIDTIMLRNNEGLNCRLIIITRNIESAKQRFDYYSNSNLIEFIQCDINKPLSEDLVDSIDYVIHLASNTHPLQYSTDPIGTITTNIFGTYNLLEFASIKNAKRCMIASSNEIYGENRGDVEFFDELYCGYIDSNTLRAGYPESKRCSEAMCQAFISQKNLDVVVSRLTRTYGPTMKMSDSKAMSQFLKKGLSKEDIVLKSEGNQYYSYTYVADAVSGLLYVLLLGKCGEAYNIADEASDIRLKDLASIIANYADKKVVFELPDQVESAGYSKATKARLDANKIKKLGWRAKYDINKGITNTLSILSKE